MVNTYDPADMWNIPAGTVTVEAEFTYPEGSEFNPIDVVFDADMKAIVTVPAGATYYFQSWNLNGDMILTVNGEAYEFVAGTPRMSPSTFTITNDTEEALEYGLVASYKVGTMSNPAELVIGENTANIEAGNAQGYFFTWTAEHAGTLTLTISSDVAGWTYVVNNMTTYQYGDNQTSNSDPVVNPAVITVAAGDVLEIMVNTYDPANPYSAAPAGTVTVTAAFEEVHLDSDGDFVCDDEGCGVTVLPAADSVLTIEQALKIGALFVNDSGASYADNKYHIVGKITALTSTKYGTCQITDDTGTIDVYGLKDATGTNRYEYLDVKPVVGDTVKIYGKLGAYYSSVQFDNSNIIEHTAHDCDYSEATCQKVAECVICGATKGEKAPHNMVGGVCSVCGHQEGEAEAIDATLSFDNVANRTSFSTSQQVWEQNGITLTNNKAGSTSNVADYSAPARFYKSSEVVIEAGGKSITKIVFTCSGGTKYVTALQNSITDGTVTVNGNDVTVEFSSAVTSFTITLTGGQTRLASIVVTCK